MLFFGDAGARVDFDPDDLVVDLEDGFGVDCTVD